MNWPQKMANMENCDVHRRKSPQNKLNEENEKKKIRWRKKEKKSHFATGDRNSFTHKIDGMYFEEDGGRKDEYSKIKFSERIPISVHSFSRGSR